MASQRPRILYLEDDPDHRQLISLLLSDEGYETVCAEASEDVVGLVRTGKFELYLLDTWMPGMSGVEVCKQIRELDPVTPIVFYSAAAGERDKEEAFAAGARGYITKPADFHEVVSAIRKALPETPKNATALPSAQVSGSRHQTGCGD